MIFADYAFDDPNLERIAGLAHQLPNTLPNVAHQHLVPILRHPDEVILDLETGMTSIPIVHLVFGGSWNVRRVPYRKRAADEIDPPKGGGLNPTY